MNNYFISKDNKSGEIVYLEYDKDGYKAKLYAINERRNEKILINMFNQMRVEEEPEKKGKGR